MVRQFDFYEFVGYLAPGTLLLVGVVAVWPGAWDQVKVLNISLGGLGVGVIAAYALGQLLQAAGNLIEAVLWHFRGGMPTDWVRTTKRELLAPVQVTLLEARVQRMLGEPARKLAELGKGEWYSVTRQIYAAVAAAGYSARIDTFNGNYGLCRGIAAALVAIAIIVLAANWREWLISLLLLAGAAVAIYRMHRFGVHYGREMFVQFLSVASADASNGKKRGE